ncbi:MAG: hypothetical protein ABIY63_06170 [Fibrobacteria bacterium]
MTPRHLEGDTQHTDVIRSMRADASDLFFSNFRDAFRIPVAGGDPVRVLEGSKTGVQPGGILSAKGRFFLHAYSYSGKEQLYELPRTGTAVTKILDSVPVLEGESRYGLEIMSMDDTYLYWYTELTSRNGVSIPFGTQPIVIHRMPWAGGPAETLATLESENDGFQRSGDRLLLLQKPYNDSDKSERLYSIPVAGGVPVVVADYPASVSLVEADADYAYIVTEPEFNEATNTMNQYGLVKQPLAAGQALVFLTQLLLPNRVWADPDRLVIFDYGQVKPSTTPLENYAEAVFSVPLTGGALSFITCLDIPDAATVHATTKDGKNLYLTSNASSGEDAIFHITLP